MLPKFKVVNKTAGCSYAKLMDMNETEITCKYYIYIIGVFHTSLFFFLSYPIYFFFVYVLSSPGLSLPILFSHYELDFVFYQ